MIPLSLYIHIPWCIRKCPYCDFNSHAVKEGIPEQRYIDALLADLEVDLPHAHHRPIHSIFFGGGTPSLLSAEAIADLLTALKKMLCIATDCEITLEANPGTVEQERFRGFYDAGINRLSLGVQSFNDTMLTRLGRIHSGFDAQHALDTLRIAGFERFNIDIMHGLPGQTCDDALEDLRIAMQYQPAHLSWYQLTIEPNTAFYSRPPPLPIETDLESIENQGKAYIASQSLVQYEISAYARTPADRCRHNMNYWQFGDYLGIGAGAHSKLTDPQTRTITRINKVRQPSSYLDPHTPFIAQQVTLDPGSIAFEFMLNALRLTQPVSRTLFEVRTGLSFDQLQPGIAQAMQKDLIECDSNTIAITPLGQRFLNDVINCFSKE